MGDQSPFQCELWIDGRASAAESDARLDVFEPATGERLARVAQASVGDAAARGRCRGARLPQRALAEGARSRAGAHAACDRGDDPRARKGARDARGAQRRQADRRRELGDRDRGAVLRVLRRRRHRRIRARAARRRAGPLAWCCASRVGPCALIVPWNFPFLIAAWKVAPALAAGNTAVLKPASATPLSALRLVRAGDRGRAPGRRAERHRGARRTAWARRSRAAPAIRKVSFTGDSENGAAILRLAAPDIKRVSLELGGKSASVVFADADLDALRREVAALRVRQRRARTAARARGSWSRQSIHDAFVERFAAATQRAARRRSARPGDPGRRR